MRECVYLGGDGTFSSFCVFTFENIGEVCVIAKSLRQNKKESYLALFLTRLLTNSYYLLPLENTGKFFMT